MDLYSKSKMLFTRWTTPPAPAAENEVRYWQDKLLFTLLLAGLVLGFFVYIPSVALSIKEKLWIVAFVDTLLYGWVAVLFFNRRLPFAVRAYSVVYMSYVLGLVLLLTVGPFGSGPVWLFAFPVLAAVFMGLRISIIALVINGCSIIMMGFLISRNMLQLHFQPIDALARWVVIALNFMFLDALLAISAAYIARGLMISLEQEKTTRGSLERKHHTLANFTRALKAEINERKRAEVERKHQEKERRRLEDRLRQAQKMEAIGTLAGGIAHDFNNILSSVIGYTELGRREAAQNSATAEYFEEILKAGIRAKNLVKQILTFARKGDEIIRPTQVSIIAKELLKMLRSVIPATIEIRHDIRSTSLVMADPTQIHQVFMNLCTNAAQAMEEAGGILTVRLNDKKIERSTNSGAEEIEPGTYLELTVSDTGGGIPKEDLGSIFDPYFTTKPVGKGTGLGLSVVHGIVKGCKGKVAVDSEPGNGTVFTIYLPVFEGEMTHFRASIQMSSTGDERILIVDDEVALVNLKRQCLERLGYRIRTATTPVEAIEMFRKDPAGFDLIITDMTMPQMTGEKMAGEILKTRNDIPIILCTGHSGVVAQKAAVPKGIVEYLEKPVDMKVLADSVRKALDTARIR